MSKLNVLLISMMLATCGQAFSPAVIIQKQSAATTPSIIGYNHHHQTSTHLFAGFGAGGGGKKKKAAKKEQKLKPKQQWDRFSDLKKETSVGVAVRVGENDDWLEVGRVKSKEGVSTEVAVAKQRVVIADHSRRLYPLQVSKSTMVEWGYQVDDEYKVVDIKSVLDGQKEGIEKEVGFEGTPDPASGFYCMYKDGKILDGNQGGKRKVL